jgi:hypothetical protein
LTRLRDFFARLFAYIALVPGRRVTIGLINDEIVTGRVRSVWGNRAVVLSYRAPTGWIRLRDLTRSVESHAVVRSRIDEGVSWCRGWRGRDVDAFLAGWALR